MPFLQFPSLPGAILYFLSSSYNDPSQASSDDGAVHTDKMPCSAELSDCINFMNKWDQGAQVCYAFLENGVLPNVTRGQDLERFMVSR
jgi:hypothetical protein